MFGAIAALAVVPWLDSSPVRSARYRPLYRPAFWLLVIDSIVLGWIGKMPPEGHYLIIGRLATAYYFFHFLVLLPLLGRYEKPLPVPATITDAIKKLVVIGLLSTAVESVVFADNSAKQPKQHFWPHRQLFGGFNKAQLQRGFQVYKQVCSTCHSLNQLAYRDLMKIDFSEAEVKAIAAEYQFKDGPDEEGEMFERKGTPGDRFHDPYANPQEARAANQGSLPPDLSLIIKARPGGENYLFSLLTGYSETPPADFKLQDGLNYNPYMGGGQIAMTPPLVEGIVTYDDGTPATIAQMAEDVTCFLAWAAEPELEQRKRLGIKIILFVAVFTGLCYLSMRKIWGDLKP